MSVLQTHPPGLADEEMDHLNNQAMWSVGETARYLRVSEKLVRRYVSAGAIFAIRIGRWIRVPRERLLKDLEADRIPMIDADRGTLGA